MRRPRLCRGFCFAELMLAVTMLLFLWILALSESAPHLEVARRTRISLHREAATSASLLALHARYGEVPRDASEIAARLVGTPSGRKVTFRHRSLQTRVLPDAKGGIVLQEVPR